MGTSMKNSTIESRISNILAESEKNQILQEIYDFCVKETKKYKWFNIGSFYK